jgi:hypothetical protein
MIDASNFISSLASGEEEVVERAGARRDDEEESLERGSGGRSDEGATGPLGNEGRKFAVLDAFASIKRETYSSKPAPVCPAVLTALVVAVNREGTTLPARKENGAWLLQAAKGSTAHAAKEPGSLGLGAGRLVDGA